MIRVRFDTGLVVQYNDLDAVDVRPGFFYLGKQANPGGYWAIAPLSCIVEHVVPCRVYRDGDLGVVRQQALIDDLRATIRRLEARNRKLKASVKVKW